MVKQDTLQAVIARGRPHADAGRTDLVALTAPRVGLWRSRPAMGTLIRPGDPLGAIEILGVVRPLVAPPGATGLVVEIPDDDRARIPVGFGTSLVVLDPEAGMGAAADAAGPSATSAEVGLAFTSPMSGRFYARSSPDKPPFVEAGQTIRTGDTVCLLEVMKTFNRVTYGGAGLPETARVKRIVPADGDDLTDGDPIIELEAE